MVAIQLEWEESKKEEEEYIAQLKKCIVLRDEQLTAAMNQIRERDKIIDDFKSKIRENETKIYEVNNKVYQITKEKENQTMNIREPVRQRNRKSQQQQRQVNCDLNFGRSAYTAHYILNMKEPGERRKMNPFHVEDELTDVLGHKPRSIIWHGRNCFIVEVSSKQQSD